MPDSKVHGEPDWTGFIYGRHHLGKHSTPESIDRVHRVFAMVLIGAAVVIVLLMAYALTALL